jgi:type II secretory ATPase GspE/PulE/Tfp pilus assembly ATPase PilB-like protein
MRRIVTVAACVGALFFLGADVAWAQPAGGQFTRGGGFYFSFAKAFLLWIDFFLWVFTTDWVNRDSQERRMNWAVWNAACFFPYMGMMMAYFAIPFFFVSLPLLYLAHWLPLGFYIRARNQVVEPQEKVMNGDHIRYWFATKLNRIGFKMDTERKTLDEIGAPVKLIAMGGASERHNTANMLTARQSPGFLLVRELVYDAFGRRSDTVLFDYTQEKVGIRYQIDGVWHEVPDRDRESGDVMLAVMKCISALNPSERRAKQEGEFAAELQGKSKLVCKLVSQGTPTGERALLMISDGKPKSRSLANLGMRERMQEEVKQLVNQKSGFVLIAAPPTPGAGMTTTFDAIVEAADRFTRPWVALEKAGHREREIENVPITTYDSAQNEDPSVAILKLARTYPEVYVLRDLVDAELITTLCAEITDSGRMVVAAMRARDGAEALVKILAMNVPPKTFASVASGVVSARLIRTLCTHCKVSYLPAPQILQQLKIPAQVKNAMGDLEPVQFAKPPDPPEDPRMICKVCGGIGYHGRTGIFELIVLNDELRRLLAAGPKVEVLRAELKKAGQRSLQDEGLLLVSQGLTSLPELMRVLKE